ncbi:MAG: DUF4446 family protein [Desulfitobacterium sp.]|nr:DUF4446 family protein [Desulfitobacterium sp.]
MGLDNIMPLEWWAILGLGVFSLLQFIIILVLNNKMKRFRNSYIALQSFLDGSSLDQQLKDIIIEIRQLREDIDQVDKRLQKGEKKLKESVDRVELIRYDAFANKGSDLSFSLAMLNQEGNGVVITSINNRDESRFYGKPIVYGESTYHLSEEEKLVINKAKETVKI